MPMCTSPSSIAVTPPGVTGSEGSPFVQLHQASQFYGVASTLLGTGGLQEGGPEAGLQERAGRSEIQNYYDAIMYRRFLGDVSCSSPSR